MLHFTASPACLGFPTADLIVASATSFSMLELQKVIWFDLLSFLMYLI